MILRVVTPLAVVVDTRDVVYVRAEDESGAFGILAGHAGLLTSLSTSVVTWRERADGERYVAVRGGVLEVRADEVLISTREAVTGSDLQQLQSEVVARFQRDLAAEQAARADAQRLYLAALRQIVRYLRPGGRQTLREAQLGDLGTAVDQ